MATVFSRVDDCVFVVLLSLVLSSGAIAAQEPTLLVAGYTSGAVHAFAPDGVSLGTLGSAPGAQSMRYGPDGNLYVCAEEQPAVLRFDGQTGAALGPFVFDDPLTPIDETGGLRKPVAAVFGRDGMLYVASFQDDAVLRYDGVTGAYIDDFIPSGTGAINGPDAGMDFGPDGHLYIPSFNNNRVLRYHGKTGNPLGAFVPQSLTISRPRSLRWRGDGVLYVASWGNNRILRYDLSGNFLGIFATPARPTGIAFGPGGHVYVTSDQSSRVLMYHGTTGAPLGEFGDVPGAGVVAATYLEWLPNPELRFQRPWPGTAGVSNTYGITNATPNGQLFLALGVAPASLPFSCPNTWFGVDISQVFLVTADAAGAYSNTVPVDAAAVGLKLVLQAYDPAGACLSNLVLTTFN